MESHLLQWILLIQMMVTASQGDAISHDLAEKLGIVGQGAAEHPEGRAQGPRRASDRARHVHEPPDDQEGRRFASVTTVFRPKSVLVWSAVG